MGMIKLDFGFWNPDLGFHVWNPKVMGMIMLYFGFWNPDLGFHVWNSFVIQTLDSTFGLGLGFGIYLYML
jgi:hypothetical protein